MLCSFCTLEADELWPTTQGNRGCEDCLANLMECGQCGVFLEKGGGQWWDDGLCYCHKCARGVPQCLWCERPAFQEAANDSGRIICVYCADRFPHCDHCSRLIHGDCLTYLDKVYCRACADKYPLCLDCGQAIAAGGECGACGGPARACGGCGKIFSERWMVHEETFFCPKCYWRACGRCRFCQEKKYTDHDSQCHDCRSELVTGLPIARDLLDEVQWFCSEELGLKVKQPYQLKMAETASAIPKLHTDAYTLGLSAVGLWAGRDRTMWVQKGFPIWFTSVILAHEHAHAWQTENCPQQSQDLLEGFASWVEWHVALNLGYETFAENMLSFGCPIYGRGLRRCRQLEAQVGPAELVAKMRTMKTFSLWTSFWAEI